MTQWSIQFNFPSGQGAKGVQIYKEGSKGGILINSVAFDHFPRKNICVKRRASVVPFPWNNVASNPFRLTGLDVTFFFARKIVSEAGYVIVENLPQNFRCDYKAGLIHKTSPGIHK